MPARLREEFAGIDRLYLAQLLRMLFQHLGEVAEQYPALRRQLGAPGSFGERAVRCLNRAIDISLACGWNFGPGFAGRRIDTFKRVAAVGIDPLAIDVHPVLLELRHRLVLLLFDAESVIRVGNAINLDLDIDEKVIE